MEKAVSSCANLTLSENRIWGGEHHSKRALRSALVVLQRQGTAPSRAELCVSVYLEPLKDSSLSLSLWSIIFLGLKIRFDRGAL